MAWHALDAIQIFYFIIQSKLEIFQKSQVHFYTSPRAELYGRKLRIPRSYRTVVRQKPDDPDGSAGEPELVSTIS